MAQSGYTPILIYASGTTGNTPSASNLTSSASGAELALNYYDGKLFYKDASGNVQVLASKAGNINVSSISFGTTGLTPNTATTGAVTVAGTLATTNGGTGLTSFTANGVVYASSTSALATGSALTFDGSNFKLTGSDNNNLVWSVNSNAGAQSIRIQANVAGLYLQGAGTVDPLYITQSSATGYIVFRPASDTEQMRLTSAGLGIGTSSPAYKLDVSGQVRINGNQLLIQNTTSSSYADYNSTGGDFYVGLDNSAGSGLGTGTAYAASFVRTGAYPFIWRNNGSNNMTLDSSGNLGLGVTPSANWSGVSALQLNTAGSLSSNNLYTSMQNGLVATSGGYAWKFLTSTYGLAYFQNNNNGQHQWYTTTSAGTAGNTASPAQIMTLNASGQLLVGVTSPFGNGKISVNGNPAIEINGPATSAVYPSIAFYNTNGVIAGAKDGAGSGADAIRLINGSNYIAAIYNGIGVNTLSLNNSTFAVGTPFDGTSGSQTASFVGSKSGYAGYTMLPQGQLAIYDSSGTGVGAGGAISFMGYQSSSGTWYGSIQAYKANSTSTDYGAHMRFYTRPSGSVNTTPNLTLLNTLQTIVNGSGGYLGNSGLELQGGSMAVNSKGSTISFASLQMIGGYVAAGSSGTYTTFCFISESHSANIRVMAVDNRGENYGIGSWIGVSNIAYGGGSGPTATQTGFLSGGSITGLTVQYNNIGYILQAAVTYSGASSGVTIYFSVDANAAQSIYSS
jgi:hypothetical protein